jgi:cytochrome c553
LGLILLISAARPGNVALEATLAKAPADTIAARVQGCSTCHGTVGEGTKDGYFPRIAGKPAGYLFNQLQNFREGRRSYPPMNYLLAYLHDDYLSQMAIFFSAQRVAFASPEQSVLPEAELEAGANLAMHGNANGVPACVACHGPKLTGMNPGIPGLLGLHSRYISAQLEAWRAGTRRAQNPDCMHDVASRLSETEITEVSAWLSMQSASVALVPAAVGRWKTPLPCGSEPQ